MRLTSGQLVPDPPPGVEAALHGHLGDAGEVVEAHEVADHRYLRVVGDGQVGVDLDAAGPVLLGAGGGGDLVGERRRLDARGPQHGAGVVARLVTGRIAHDQAVPVHVGDQRVHVQLDAAIWSTSAAFADSFDPNDASGSAPPSKSSTRASLRVEIAELGPQRLARQLSHLPGQLDAGRSAADQGEGEPASLLVPDRSRSRPSRTRRTPCAGWLSASASVFMPGAHCAYSSWPK